MDKVERLTNLVALLLTSSRARTLDEIAETVEGYPPPGEARRAAFERDKRTLRAEGVPLEVVPQPDGGSGYRIDPDEYYLPALDLDDDERVALNLAVAAVALDGRAGRDALWKLGEGAGGGASFAAMPTTAGLPELFDAWRRGAPARFRYNDQQRTLDVWGVAFRAGRWYVVGFDHARDSERLFRVDRISGAVTLGADGTAGRAPEGFDPADALPGPAYGLADDGGEVVEVDVDAGWATVATREVGSDALVDKRADGSVRLRFTITSRDGFRLWLFGYLDHAVVVSPPDLVAYVVGELEAMAGG